MQLNQLKPAKGAKRLAKRVGRGTGSGHGKTSGRGHKGQHARSGGFHKVGFEGGQMPLQRRLPKFGFTSRKALQWARIRVDALNRVDAENIDINVLKKAKIINSRSKFVKVFLAGEITKAVNLKGITVSKGAREAIEAAGGKAE